MDNERLRKLVLLSAVLTALEIYGVNLPEQTSEEDVRAMVAIIDREENSLNYYEQIALLTVIGREMIAEILESESEATA